MKPLIPRPTRTPELSWLLDVTESRQPLSENSPVWVRHGFVSEGPPTPYPERHPHCELSIVLEEADETAYWLELLLESGHAPADAIDDLLTEADEITAMTVASIKTLKSRYPR